MTPIDLIQQIARGEEVGYTGRNRAIGRGEMIARCRALCDTLGLSYSPGRPHRSDKPTSPRVASEQRILIVQNTQIDDKRTRMTRVALCRKPRHTAG